MKLSHSLLLLAIVLLGAFLFAAASSSADAETDTEIHYEEEDDVLVLTSDNFKKALKDFSFLLVEFYAPWCGHCKSLAPEYAAAASLLKQEGHFARLAKVDATVHQDLGSKYGVQGYPTLKLFRDGVSSEYTGGRTTDTIIEWIRKKTGPAAETLTTPEQVEEFKEKSEVSVIAYFPPESANLDHFLAIASESEFVTYALVSDKALLGADASGDEAIVLYKKFDDLKNVYEGDFSQESITKFVGVYSVPLVSEFLPNIRIFSSHIRKHFFLFVETKDKDAAKEALLAPATQFRGEVLFTVIDVNEQATKRIAEYFNANSENVPQGFVFIIADTPIQYKHDSHEIDSKSYTEFVQGVLDGTIQPFFKTEEPEEYSGKGVRVLVGTDHDLIVNDPTKNVLVEYYAPWCGHCKTLAPIYDLVAESFDDIENVVIAKIDSTKNEVSGVNIQGFPTLILYPAGENASPINYDGAREYEDIRAFVELHGVGVPQEDSKKETSDEL